MKAQNKYKIKSLLFGFRSIWASILLVVLLTTSSFAQQKTDTVIVNVGKSKIIFVILDPQDVEEMKNYDLNAMIHQLAENINSDKDTTVVIDNNVAVSEEVVQEENDAIDEDEMDSLTDEDEDEDEVKKRRARGTSHFTNFDFGTNNYLNEGSFPDEDNALYSVRPWGSWYVGINSIYRTYLNKAFYVEWGGGISWYNFKFENDHTRVFDTANGVDFQIDSQYPGASFRKSKLTATYISASIVPVIAIGDRYKRDRNSFWDWSDGGEHSGFRIGFGGYAGYRIDSYSKIVFDLDGDKKKKRNHDNYSLENFRYGARIQLGLGDTDFFFNYDLNELFSEGRGPKLNAFSFGMIL